MIATVRTTRAWVGLAVIASLPIMAAAQIAPPDVTITPKPVGSGARALGQSAFIAVADDATAASWNPAGLIQLERPEVSFVGAWLINRDRFHSGSADFRGDSRTWDSPEFNFASVAVPFVVGGRDLVVALNYHQVYDFGLEGDFFQVLRGAGTTLPLNLHVRSEGAVSASSLAAGFSIAPSLTLGAAVNFYHDSPLRSNAWEVKTTSNGRGTLGGVPAAFRFSGKEVFDNFHAVNATVGVLFDAWAADEKVLTFGAVVHTPFRARVERRTTAVSVLNGTRSFTRADETIKIDFPFSVGAGVNYRASDTFSLACDVQWTDWSSLQQIDGSGRRSSPVGGDRWGTWRTLSPSVSEENTSFPVRTGSWPCGPAFSTIRAPR